MQYFSHVDLVTRNLAKFISTDLEQIWVSKHFPNHFSFQIIKKTKNENLLLLLGRPVGTSWPTATLGLLRPSEGECGGLAGASAHGHLA